MNQRLVFQRRALTFLDLIMGGVATFLLFALVFLIVLFPSLSRARELSKRTVCAANLKGMGNSFAVYATANNDEFPIPPHLEPAEDGVGRVRYAPGQIGAHRGKLGEPEAGETTTQDKEMSTTRAMWVLVRMGASSPRSFICPSSDDQPNMDDNPQDFWDFRSYGEVSYGYQVPFGKFGKPSPAGDPDMVIAADKGPYGAALEAGKPNPGPPDLAPDAEPKLWKKFNSPNHRGEGQNVLYPDAHVDFVMTPLAGWEHDNIYTRWSSSDSNEKANVTVRAHGTPPTGIETPWGESDSLIYP